MPAPNLSNPALGRRTLIRGGLGAASLSRSQGRNRATVDRDTAPVGQQGPPGPRGACSPVGVGRQDRGQTHPAVRRISPEVGQGRFPDRRGPGA
jgi:hypothetical protein